MESERGLEPRQLARAEAKPEVVHELNADLVEALRRSKMDQQLPFLSADGLTIFRIRLLYQRPKKR